MDYRLYLHWTRLLPPNRLQRAALHKTLLLPLSSLNKSIQKHDNEWTVNLTQNTASDKNRSGVFVYLLDTVTRRDPPIFPASSTEALLDVSPVAAPPNSTAGAASQGATGDISSRAAPFPWIGKGRGDRVEPLPPQTAVFPRLICGQLAISKLCPARVSGPGFIGAGIVSFPRPDLSEYCQHLNLWEVSMSSKKSVAYGSESQSTVVAGKKRIRSTSVCVWLSQDEQAKIRERSSPISCCV